MISGAVHTVCHPTFDQFLTPLPLSQTVHKSRSKSPKVHHTFELKN